MSTSFLLWNKAERKNRKRGKRKQVRRKRTNYGMEVLPQRRSR
jgi:hypothetical protein